MSEAKDTRQHPNVEITVKNFGPIVEANIDLRPLTVFVGPSNTGKTYFATLVYALHSTYKGMSGGLVTISPCKTLEMLPEFTEKSISEQNFPSVSEGEIQAMRVLLNAYNEIVLKKLITSHCPFKFSECTQVLGTILQI